MKRTLTILAALVLGVSAFAQQALYSAQGVESPVINADGTVTFRYQAPKAGKVTLSGDFLPVQHLEFEMNGQKMTYDAPGVAELREGPGGVWEYTTPFAVEPEMYTYTFTVDGNQVIDPNNVFVNRDIASLTSVLLVPQAGERSDLSVGRLVDRIQLDHAVKLRADLVVKENVITDRSALLLARHIIRHRIFRHFRRIHAVDKFVLARMIPASAAGQRECRGTSNRCCQNQRSILTKRFHIQHSSKMGCENQHPVCPLDAFFHIIAQFPEKSKYEPVIFPHSTKHRTRRQRMRIRCFADFHAAARSAAASKCSQKRTERLKERSTTHGFSLLHVSISRFSHVFGMFSLYTYLREKAMQKSWEESWRIM